MTHRGRVFSASVFQSGEARQLGRAGFGRPAAVAARRPLRRHGFAALRGRSAARRRGRREFRGALSRQARRARRGAGRGRAPVRGGARLRGAAGSDGPDHVLRVAALRRRHQRRRARQVLRRRAGKGHRARRRIAVLRTRAQSPRRLGARRGDARLARSPITVLGWRTSARSARTSSPTRSSNCSWKSR